jgi:predicted AlkP superfamily pyrophosphatase or phosphodiesterase
MNLVGLTPALLKHAPRLSALHARPMKGVFPAVTMSAQATMLTGLLPRDHGVVGNTWFWRELGEVRNWVQSNRLMAGEPFYRAAKAIAEDTGKEFTCAKMFWWFNQGSGCDFSATPKPHYGSDGSKEFDILTEPPSLGARIEERIGKFPFHAFWGPMAGLPSSRWIADATAFVMREHKPTLTLCYLPHLDYDLQRHGNDTDVPKLVKELDDCAATILDAAAELDCTVVAVSEYGITPVSRAVYLNRELRDAGLLRVRKGPFGEMLDVHESAAFAVCDHQAAHVYVSDHDAIRGVKSLVEQLPGVGRVLDRSAQHELGIDHERSGALVLMADPGMWFAYPYWVDDADAPDFARSVDIHRKPGYDPCELFLAGGKAGMGMTLLRKKLGMRYRFRSCPLDASLVKGSHGLPAADPQDGPVLACSDEGALPEDPSMQDIKPMVLKLLGV